MQVRLTEQRDARAIQQLCQNVLGYQVCLADMEQRLANLLACPTEACLLVAVTAEDEVAGFIHGQLYQALYFEPVWNVLALAVFPSYQSQGVGQSLVQALEEQAEIAGITAIRLNSGSERTAAHRFYRQQGFIERKEQKNFWKETTKKAGH